MNSGIYSVIPTFFSSDMTINVEMIQVHLLEQHRMGYNNFVFLGTTSETPTLSLDEMKEIVEVVVNMKKSTDTYVFGVGGNDPKKVKNIINYLNYTKHADIIMLTTPYYNKPSQKRNNWVFHSYHDEYSDKKFMLYNIPSRTGINVLPETFKTLKELNDNFIAIKEASGDIKQIMDIIYLLPNVKVFSGDDKLALPGYSVGTEGTISVASNFTPLVRMLYKFYCDSDLRNCKNLNAILNDLNDNLFIDSNPVPLKYLLAKKYQNIDYSFVRSPLTDTSIVNKNSLDSVFKIIRLLEIFNVNAIFES